MDYILQRRTENTNTDSEFLTLLTIREETMDNSPGGVILYASSTGSASPNPGSPSSGYQTQSPSSHSQPSSPEDIFFTEVGHLKQRGTGSNASAVGTPSSPSAMGTPPSPKLVFQFPEMSSMPAVNSVNLPVTSSGQSTHSHPLLGKKPCGFTGTFTKTDGMVLLCKVCGDIASGFHYGVHACEGCKGFFRRSIQQNIYYKMCVKNESCLIIRMNRNRCQHCRFKKCLSVGMSRDAVRFGRIPKREKQRLLDEMQSYINRLSKSASIDIDSITPTEVPLSPQEAHSDEAIGAMSGAYCNFFVSGKEKVVKINKDCSPSSFRNMQPKDSGFSQSIVQVTPQVYLAHSTSTVNHNTQTSSLVTDHGSNPTTQATDNSCYHCTQEPQHSQSYPANNSSYSDSETRGQMSCPWLLHTGAKVLACPLNACPVSPAGRSSQQVWEAFSQCFTPAVKEVVEFAKSIPGFCALSQHDQVMLLKAGTFQVLMVRFCSLFDAKERMLTFLNGQTYTLDSLRGLGMGCLLDAMFEFSEKLGNMGLEPDEMALFMAVVLVSADRWGISNVAAVEQLQEGLISALRNLLNHRRPDNITLFPKLLLRLPDLRTLNSLHSDKLIAFRIDP